MAISSYKITDSILKNVVPKVTWKINCEAQAIIPAPVKIKRVLAQLTIASNGLDPVTKPLSGLRYYRSDYFYR
ncbi:MAG: hypothetical protein ACJAUL_003343 [Paraglaciecola sp.]|jgi:hypothetical protein